MSQYPEILTLMAEDLMAACRKSDLRLAVAESCTGGLVAGCITAVAGASKVLDRGFVTYSNAAKVEMLGVDETLIDAHGAVSEQVARAMAEGAIENSAADLSLSITGIAGPGGATETKPLGLVHMAVARKGQKTLHERHVFKGDRDRVRVQAVESGLRLLNQMAGK